jgi:hypothetical protein
MALPMPIRTVEAMVPVRLSGKKERFTGARFVMLLESLSRNWVDPAPLLLSVIGRGDELAELRRLAGPRPNLELRFIDELELIDHSAIGNLDGWFKQIFIKVLFAGLCTADAYLYLDADIVCVRPLGHSHLVCNGVAISDWEPKNTHAGWWAASRELLGARDVGRKWGLAVTPNVLARDLAQAILPAVAMATGKDPIKAMANATGFSGDDCWVEQALYTVLGEMNGDLERLHAPFDGRQRYHSEADLWGREQLPAWQPMEALAVAPDSRFVVVQSSLHLDPLLIRERLAPLLDAGLRQIGVQTRDCNQ